MRVIDRQALGRTSGVAVVAVGNRRLLVGFGEQQVGLLTELGPVVELAAPAAADAAVPSPRSATDAGAPPVGARPAGVLAGSVLSPETWRATLRALQDRTVRR